jgi:hypothetical protein
MRAKKINASKLNIDTSSLCLSRHGNKGRKKLKRVFLLIVTLPFFTLCNLHLNKGVEFKKE